MSVVAQVLGHRDVKFPEPRSLTGTLLFWDHLNDQISYILTPPEDDVSDPIVDRASLPVKLPPGITLDEMAGPQPLPSKKTFDSFTVHLSYGNFRHLIHVTVTS